MPPTSAFTAHAFFCRLCLKTVLIWGTLLVPQWFYRSNLHQIIWSSLAKNWSHSVLVVSSSTGPWVDSCSSFSNFKWGKSAQTRLFWWESVSLNPSELPSRKMIGGFLTYDSLKVFGGVTICRDPSWPCLYFLIFNQITSLSPSLSSAVSLSCIKRSVYLFGRGQGWTLCMCRARQTEACASAAFTQKSGNAERVAQRCGCVYLCFGIQLPWNNQTISV